MNNISSLPVSNTSLLNNVAVMDETPKPVVVNTLQGIAAEVQLFAEKYLGNQQEIIVELLPQSGSDRRYFQVKKGDSVYIATHNLNKKENETFIYFSNHFKSRQLPVPEILFTSNNGLLYLQEYLGNESLLNRLDAEGHTESVKQLFKDSLHQLARLQVLGHDGLDYTRCLTAKSFGKQAILSDLLYFKYYFLDTLKTPYDKQQMLIDFEALADYLDQTDYRYFMFRDFQSRNIMLRDNRPFFIDYQGGMQGAPQYDAASMIWQARAELSDDWKKELLESYINSLEEVLCEKIDREKFTNQYYGFVLIRLLQVLGAYGFRGLFERKAQFLTSIPLALRNLKWFIENRPLQEPLLEFKRMLNFIVSDNIIGRFETIKASNETPLTVYLNSFSYKISGYPADPSNNGGGYVFDCRGLLNPGRLEKFKTLTGKDKEVADYLEQNTRMPDFLNNVYNLVDINVEDYLQRGFSSLMINFGCTGGQHRSVYAAEQTARHLRNKYNVRTVIRHIEQERKQSDNITQNEKV
jgi:aminoglycoside/choline kinase family phosphotransferase